MSQQSVPVADVQPGPRAGLYLDREGRWHHDGDLIRHQRLSDLLSRSVARDEAGRPIVTTGRDRLPIACEDAPVIARTAAVEGEGLALVLSTGKTEPLRPGQTLLIDDEGRLRTPVHDGEHWALLSRPATQAVLARLVEDEGGEGARLPVAGGEALVVPDGQRDWSGVP